MGQQYCIPSRITDNIFGKQRVISVISYQLSVISYQLSVPTAKAGENENTLIEYFFIPLKGGGFKP
ncbi:MAG: hypothetical protein SWX82_32905, partial [Cyanobacteriota bacterium]|nr:hypothetical protein [Cyanobacteriota bacterium]